MHMDKRNAFFSLIKNIELPKLLLSITILVATLGNLVSLLVPIITGELVDSFTNEGGVNQKHIVFFIIIFLANSVVGGIGLYLLRKVGEKASYSIRYKVWRHIIYLHTNFFDANESGSLISRIIDDTKVITDFISDKLPNFFPSLITVIGSTTILFFLDWKMTLLVTVIIPFYLLSLMALGNRMRLISIEIQNETSSFSGSLSRVLTNIRLVKISNKEEREINNTNNTLKKIYVLGLNEAKIQAILQPISGIIMLLSVGIILAVGGIRIANGDITTGTLVALVFYIIQMAVPFITLSSAFTDYKKTVGASERLNSILETPVINKTFENNLCFQKEKLYFNNVNFKYTTTPILKDISFTINNNEFIALVGPSGSGKTTLFNIIERLYEPSEGYIYYGNQKIEDIPLENWRDNIGYVMQDNGMMSGTIKENLFYGIDECISNEDLIYYSKLAHCHDFIMELENKYESAVGERGIKLSGGQKQRIDIARNLIKNPDILLLDEATSNLDSESEQHVQNALFNLTMNRTTLVIAHRLSTISKADKILFLDGGVLTGVGTHEELLATHDKYKSFVQTQDLI